MDIGASQRLLLRQGYTVGYKRVARLMKEENLSICVKRMCHQTTRSSKAVHPWVNRLESFEVCVPDQVWVGDITYVRLKGRFIYVAVLMDVFTRMIRGWHLSQHLTQSLTLKTLGRRLGPKRVSRDPPFRSRRAVSFKRLSVDAQTAWTWRFP